MENFLKAHSVKKLNVISRHKSVKLKNKLKLMLNGYKQNNTSVIRRAIELPSSADDDAAFAQEVDSALQDDSDFELVDVAQAKRSSPSVRSSSAAPDRSFTSSPPHSPAPSTSTPAPSPTSYSPRNPLNPPPKKKHALSQIASSYVSLKEEKDVVEMMDTINGILNSDSDNLEHSFAGLSDFDSSIHDIDTFVPVDSSMELSNTSSSSVSEFDANGQLAECILGKIKANTVNENDTCWKKNKVERNVENDDKNKLQHEVLPNKFQNHKNFVSALPNTKNKNSKKVKDLCMKTSERYISIDASEHSFADLPNLFTDHACIRNELGTKRFHLEGKVSNFFSAQNHDLRNAKIFEYSQGIRGTDGESEDSLPQTTAEVLDEFRNYSSDSEDEEKIEDPINNGIPISTDGIQLEQDLLAPNRVEFLHLKNGSILILRHPAQIYILGKVKATALCGVAEVMGYRLEEGSAEIFAPRFSYSIDIKTVAETSSHFGLFGRLTSVGLSVADTEDTVVSLNEHDSVIHLEPLPDIKLDFVEDEFSADVFNKTNKIMSEQFPLVTEALSCTLYTDKPSKSFELNPIWPEIVKFGSESTRKGIVCGGKGTGKSTFLKYYINKMLKHGPILLIDLDPGQPELTVAGNLSVTVVKEPLLGPNFTHLQKSIKMLNVGLINVDDNMERYLSAINHLLQYAMTQGEYQCLPWIVNTMGLSNALGLKLIAYIILLVKPTFVVQMDSNVQKKCFGTILNAQEIKRLFSEEYKEDPMFGNVNCPEDLIFNYYVSSPRQAGPENYLTAKEHRYLSFLSYFGKVLSKTNKLFLGTKPYVLQLQSMKIATTCIVKENFITDILNAKIVALCETHEHNEKTIFTLEESSLICHGHGVVRAVDLDNNSLYIISPEQKEILAQVNVLLYSDTHPDLALSCKGLPDRTCLPFRAILLQRTRQLMKSPKRRFNPIPHLLKMKKLGKHKL